MVHGVNRCCTSTSVIIRLVFAWCTVVPFIHSQVSKLFRQL